MDDVVIKIKPSLIRLCNLALLIMFVILVVDFINLINSRPLSILTHKGAFFLYIPVFLVSVFFWQKYKKRYHFIVYHKGIRTGQTEQYKEIRWEKVVSLNYMSVRYLNAFMLTYRLNGKNGIIIFNRYITDNFVPALKNILNYLPEDRITVFAKKAIEKMKRKQQI
jgi:hypothetical protein